MNENNLVQIIQTVTVPQFRPKNKVIFACILFPPQNGRSKKPLKIY